MSWAGAGATPQALLERSRRLDAMTPACAPSQYLIWRNAGLLLGRLRFEVA